jgi:aerobic-type carbon monoxide dehydrogenase small subunit (CoxS/CutS family)
MSSLNDLKINMNQLGFCQSLMLVELKYLFQRTNKPMKATLCTSEVKSDITELNCNFLVD